MPATPTQPKTYLRTLTSDNAPAPGALVRATSGRTIVRGTVTARTWLHGAIHSITVLTSQDGTLRHHTVYAMGDSWQPLAPAVPLVELHWYGPANGNVWRPAPAPKGNPAWLASQR